MMATRWSGLSQNLPLPSQMVTSMPRALWEELQQARVYMMSVLIQMEGSVAESSTRATSQLSQKSTQSGFLKLYTMIGLRQQASQQESMIRLNGALMIPATL